MNQYAINMISLNKYIRLTVQMVYVTGISKLNLICPTK